MEKRTILFRGKRVDNGEWITGDLIANSASPFVFIRADVGLKVDDPIRGKDVKVIQDTVGQFTGLTDKNGKRIFEGDVLGGCNGSINGHGWEQKPILIKFSEGRFNVPLWAAKGEWDSTHYLVVIGNTHDNPELS